jgi:hypothetical protein
MAKAAHPVPFVEGYVPGTPKPKKAAKTWVDELNELGTFLLGQHQEPLLDALTFASDFTPAAGLRDTMDASKTVSEGVMNLNPWETGIGLAGILTGFLPGKTPTKEFDLIHGSKHDFKPEGNEIHGKFDLGKVLTGEGTNYEGKGIYATEPKATGVAKSYAHMGSDVDPTIKIGDKDTFEILKELKENEGLAGANTADKLDALQQLEKMIFANNPVSKPASADNYIDDILEYMSFPDPESGKLIAPPENVIDFLNNFRGKETTMTPPGGFIYDFKVHDSPDNFINMHLPIPYQDDKIIAGVDEWLKNMPISEPMRDRVAFSYGNKRAGVDNDVRDYYREIFMDPYRIPKEPMSKLLANEYINEHMDIIKDQGILGTKWFSRHMDGARHRENVKEIFKGVADIDSMPTGTPEVNRYGLEEQIKNLTEQFENMPITDTSFDKLLNLQTKINMLNKKLADMDSPDDLVEQLWKIYNDPHLAYNYTINDPSKTTIVNKKFVPK